jgi:uncharacterized protein DUF6886
VQYVYHVSETPGIEEFVPRKFWHVNYSYSGPVRAASDIPANAVVITCFYASSEEYAPFYYPPKRCQRLFVWRRKNSEAFNRLSQLLNPLESDKVIFFDQRDRSFLEMHEFSIYAFDSRKFERLPNGEFVTRHPVAPVEEIRRKNALLHLVRAGYQVEFVEDLALARETMRKIELSVDSEGI